MSEKKVKALQRFYAAIQDCKAAGFSAEQLCESFLRGIKGTETNCAKYEPRAGVETR